MTDRREEFLAEFERAGEDEVRRRLAMGDYHALRSTHARQWLSRRETQRESDRLEREETFKREQTAIARSAKNAAWVAAIAAIIAAIIAVVAILVSLRS